MRFQGWTLIMSKSFIQLTVMGMVVVFTTACQTLDTVRLKNLKETELTKSNTLIYCSGTESCEFERLDSIKIIDENNHHLEKEAIRQGIVRLKGKSLKDSNPIYLSVPAKQYELVIRFYPISKDRAEKLHVIHNFKANQTYTFNMYRDRSRSNGSLLNVSAPEPLCVELKQGKKTIRRFCKPYNVLNGLGEFVEKKI